MFLIRASSSENNGERLSQLSIRLFPKLLNEPKEKAGDTLNDLLHLFWKYFGYITSQTYIFQKNKLCKKDKVEENNTEEKN